MKKDSIGKYLSIAYRAQASLLNRNLDDYGIGRGQYPFLIALYHQEGICQQTLCKIYNIDKAAAGRALQKLEKEGFVIRRKDPKDKRKYLIHLTEKGRRFKSEFIEILNSTEAEIKNGLTTKEIDLFLNIIKKICSNLGFNCDEAREE